MRGLRSFPDGRLLLLALCSAVAALAAAGTDQLLNVSLQRGARPEPGEREARQLMAAAAKAGRARPAAAAAGAGAAMAAAAMAGAVGRARDALYYASLPAGDAAANSTAETALRAKLLESYDKGTYPWAELGPANASINIVFHKILKVDLYAGTLDLAVWFQVYWTDRRLSWDPRQWAGPSGPIELLWWSNSQHGDVDVWQPDIVLWNAAEPMLYTLSQKPVRGDSEGNMFWTRNGVLKVACNFEGLSAFPFGSTRCLLEIGSWLYGRAYVDLHPLNGVGFNLSSSVTNTENAIYTEYTFNNVTSRRYEYPPYSLPRPYPRGVAAGLNTWPVVLYEVSLSRQTLMYSLKILTPQIVLTAVAFSTFWPSPECGERLGLAVTVPLAVAVYDLIVFGQLPVSNKLSFVSALGLMGFLFSMAALLVNAISIQLYYYRDSSYFRGLSVVAATFLAYREQCVWVDVLKVINQLRNELSVRQLAALEKEGRLTGVMAGMARLAGKSNWARRPGPAGPVRSAASNCSKREPQSACGVSAGDDDESDQTDAATAGSTRRRTGMRERLRAAQGEAAVQVGLVPHDAPGGEDAQELESRLLGATSEAALRAHLLSILAPAPELRNAKVQRAVRKAVAVFGLDGVAARLHYTLAGERAGEAMMAGQLSDRLAVDFNRRWRLLSSIVDHLSRYIFVITYTVAMLTIGLVLGTSHV